jgi:hypothetical protein
MDEADEEPTPPPEPPEQDVQAPPADDPAQALSGPWAVAKEALWTRAVAVAPGLTRPQFERELRMLVQALGKTGREETISAGTRRRWYDEAENIFSRAAE